MFIIAGLGNPTKEYEKTRHNTGFCSVDALADRYGIPITERKYKALIGKGVIEGHKTVLVKPQTFMNASGESLRAVMDFYKADPSTDLIVIFDDVSLDPGQLRIRKKGSAGGHNGVKSIIAHLGTQEFARVKVGIGKKPERMDLADYVLGHFSAGEQKVMDEAFRCAASAAVMMMEDIDRAMNIYNVKQSPNLAEGSMGEQENI